ncbi:MAG: (E)-4-hydroxy-3-methylbut-2-enyl-diphosphate synthase [Bacteroidetes bacterium]|nr:(E)-4-hydroxy-3-methylbut-2-enyl-diphosphate synthase [Bacteroidota bacterium]MBU1116326.1 (E)-4-hydroxy-3-methylbut-2-enyl-diphosphate synthase [Bacteroidota bacterium]MBU1796986.1 (E)-4-hydroxy-3-methylbut-2-enyl-diphosphate synthase [Bacteroidota bacterium]
MYNKYKYCNSLTEYSRLKTRTVKIGNLEIGGNNPIRIQSMTTTNTMDTIATVEQAIRMYKSGSELVRITAPSLKDAENLQNIKDELRKRGYDFPLIADIHFTPNAAEAAARIVEKVRVNPGNYVDKKKFDQIEYNDEEYKAEIERITERFSPLVKICKEYGTAMRIGTNHGSLSDRIMSRYGDTPLGMVESALEFVRICQAHDYHNLVLSMKSSNPQVMVHAYRLLINKMIAEGMNYPLHLGVTEAGDGDDARIKSSVGIGTLLEDGIGDTVRVSLTEPPENEAPVAKKIVAKYSTRNNSTPIKPIAEGTINPFIYEKRTAKHLVNIGDKNVPIVVADFSRQNIDYNTLEEIGYTFQNDKWNMSDSSADYIYLGNQIPEIELPQNLFGIVDFSKWSELKKQQSLYPLLTLNEYLTSKELSNKINFLSISINDLSNEILLKIKNDSSIVIVLSTVNKNGMIEQRRAFGGLIEKEMETPVIIRRNYHLEDSEQLVIDSSTDLGALFLEGLGDGIWISNSGNVSLEKINLTAFGILQATRTRITKTEYIACPSCGRTLFDLVEVTNKIRSRTNHLKGIKIGIMGCIVNGPGEMADADYGYVGSGVGKITLYRGQKVVERNLNQEVAVDRLIQIIKDDDNWVEKV